MNMCPSHYRSSAVPVFKQSSFIHCLWIFYIARKDCSLYNEQNNTWCLEIPDLLLRLPVGCGGVINSPRSVFLCFYYSACHRRGRVLKCPRFCFYFFFSVSKAGLPLMGYTAVQYTDCYLSPCQHDF